MNLSGLHHEGHVPQGANAPEALAYVADLQPGLVRGSQNSLLMPKGFRWKTILHVVRM